MPRKRSTRTPSSRQGVVLLVVISLLVLFFVVGLAFVIYSSAQATNARVWREGQTVDYPEMDPEMLLSYFMGQLIYGTTNPNSALNANPIQSSLAPNMYGVPGSTEPYGGGPNGGVPYTYPDRQNLYLAAIKAGNVDFFDPATNSIRSFPGTDGAVLIPSYARITDPATGQLIRMGRPASLPAPANPLDGDVKNLTWSPGMLVPGSKAAPQFVNNDSHWMDLGFAVTTAPDGRRYKPLFAPLIMDLDNKLNVNVHGNIMWHTNSTIGGGDDPRQGRHTSHQGLGPWEVSPERVLVARDNSNMVAESPDTVGNGHYEHRRLFVGDMDSGWNRRIAGRYRTKWGNSGGAWGEGWHQQGERFTIRGPYYSPINFDANFPRTTGLPRYPGYWDGTTPRTTPSFGFVPSFSAFPYFSGDYDGGRQDTAGRNHPLSFNFFNPSASLANYGSSDGLIFDIRDMEPILRYGDTNAPAMRSELLRTCSLSLADAKARRMVTTHAFDWDRPGITPVAQPDPADTYQFVPPPAGPRYPIGTSYNSEPYDATGARRKLGRVNLNTNLPQGVMGNMNQKWYLQGWGAYPDVQWFWVNDPVTTGAGVWLPTGRIDLFASANQIINAIRARQTNAKEIFNYARYVTGAPDPNDPAVWAALPPEQKDALRWLAQLAVNIVDYVDLDDNITPFRWKDPDATDPQGQWVFGVELPRLTLNEVYADVVNDPADTTRADNDYRVRFWAELNNPHYGTQYPRPYTEVAEGGPFGPSGSGFQAQAMPLNEGSKARLRVPARANSSFNNAYGWGVYRLTICQGNTNLNAPGNSRGDPDPASVKTEVLSWFDRNVREDGPTATTEAAGEPTWDDGAAGSVRQAVFGPTHAKPQLVTMSMGGKYPPWEDEIHVVRPMDKYPKGADEDNYGYYVVGPLERNSSGSYPNTFPGNDPNRPKATLRIPPPRQSNGAGGFLDNTEDWNAKRGMMYRVGRMSDPAAVGSHTVLLRRLCNPNMPPNTDTNSPLYNPYVTVDYMENVPVNDRVRYSSTGNRAAAPPTATDPKQCFSVGRSQPYGGHSSQQVRQKPFTQLNDQAQHTFFDLNVQAIDPATGNEARNPGGQLMGFAFHWLCHADRPLISPMELLEVACCKPHELTQQFVQGPNDPSTNEPMQRFGHRAPWLDPKARIYRLLEVLSTTPIIQMQAVGGRVLGRVNINTIFDREMFRAILDPQPCNLFTAADVEKAYDKMMTDRSPNLTPSPLDKPFRGLSFDPTLGGIDDTLLRMDATDVRPMLQPQDKRRLFEPEAPNFGVPPNPAGAGSHRGHPYGQYEMLRKMANNITTRSNVFAVFLTVGFFEVNAADQPIAEVRRNEGRHVRHRMFAVVDRSNLALVVNQQTRQPAVPLQPATAPPVAIPSWSPVPQPLVAGKPERYEVEVPDNTVYEGRSWTLNINDWILIDSGDSQELVQIKDKQWRNVFNATRLYIAADFTKGHMPRVPIIKVTSVPGNPGPQPRFDIRNPVHGGVLPYWSIVE